MANATYMASLRKGGKAAPGSRRVTITLRDAEYEDLRELADTQHRTVGGTAADLVRRAIKVGKDVVHG
jgi:hypothetical protein